MTNDEIRYALAKQVQSVSGIETAYGTIDLGELDEQARREIRCALTDALERELSNRTRVSG